MEKQLCISTCQGGLEEVLKEELESLGITVDKIGYRMVSYYADKNEIYRCNMALRIAINVLVHLKTFKVKDYDLLYFRSKKINWHKLFSLDNSIRIDVKGKSTILENSQYTIHRIKDGISDTFRKFFDGQRPYINKRHPDIHVVAYVNGDEVSLYLDSSGEPLFKRGYRQSSGEAPIKEDLAAGILLMSDWDKKSPVLDPMCGSGTFLFEAYMIANQIPPNLNRQFSFMNWLDYEEEIYKLEKEKLEKQIEKSPITFTGIEIDRATHAKARKILRNNFPESNIQIKYGDFLEVSQNFENHFIVTNPPYGERIGTEEEVYDLHKNLGDFLKQKCKNSTASIFTANIPAGKKIGLKPTRRIVLFNGPLEGRLFKFELY